MPRAEEPWDPAFKQLNSSIGFDWRLAPYDIDQSRAHAAMLASIGVLTDAEAEEIRSGLDQVAGELDEDRFPFEPDDEDIHMAIERRLTELIGPVGGKLQTGRSRNDQVATDMSMFVRAHCLRDIGLIRDLLTQILDAAERHTDWALPGYTHLQRAQPVYLAHHLLAYFWMFRRDADRFRFALGAAGDLPLGSGALAGVNFEPDRRQVASELGFDGVTRNSLDSTSNRDFVLDYLNAAATCATHLSRLGAELVLWSSSEFGFCEIGDSFTSGSSLMPQKKNPDAAELLRAKAPRVVARYAAFQGVLHGLPLTYNKDLQEDKEGLFDASDTLEVCLIAARGMLAVTTFDRERMAAAAADEFTAATDLADFLVERGVPFREAHSAVGGLVRHALAAGKTLSEIEPAERIEFSEHFGEDLAELLSPDSVLESKRSVGGTSGARVREQLALAREALAELA